MLQVHAYTHASLREFLVAVQISLCQWAKWWYNHWMSIFDPLCSEKLSLIIWWFTTLKRPNHSNFSTKVFHKVGVHLICDVIFNDHFIVNFLTYLPVKEFWKFVTILVSYCHEFDVSVGTRCINAMARFVFTVRRYASALYAVVVCLSVSVCVCLWVCVCHTPVLQWGNKCKWGWLKFATFWATF